MIRLNGKSIVKRAGLFTFRLQCVNRYERGSRKYIRGTRGWNVGKSRSVGRWKLLKSSFEP